MKARIAVLVRVDVAKVITALSGLLLAIGYVIRHW